jgi:hypothetical protein
MRPKRVPVPLVVRAAGDILGHQLGHAFDVDLRAGAARAIGYRAGHGFDMPVGGVVQDQDLGHDESLEKKGRGKS